jgi:HD-GYP domain-containing protein (c-di-GMP phosphodiesterase class II)
VALADVYDALTSERPYKEAYSAETARQVILEESGRHFDPIVVRAFEARFEDFVKVQLQCPTKYVRVYNVAQNLLAELCK